MADTEKKTGAPIDDDALNSVVGGVVPSQEVMVQIRELLTSGERPEPLTTKPLVLVRPDGIPSTIDIDQTRKIAEEMRQGINLGNLSDFDPGTRKLR